MKDRDFGHCTAFEGTRRIASGELGHVVLRVKEVIDRGETAPVLIFDDVTSELVEVDFRGTAEEVVGKLEPRASDVRPAAAAISPVAPRGPGRPKLGVVAREVTLLPRHWDWLNEQPGGASVALRKLVEAARRENEGRDRARRAQESAYRFMVAMAGNLPGFEEATRALFAKDPKRLEVLICDWPEDVRTHVLRLARETQESPADAATAETRS
ncbi:DUF2239 family protein [Singulisphaera sp. Ch08]|uniref:DUF2239 family protein n=1 Tax=Singulisphaera sp. Ch08 TaxID=3120278 RepID=A0AAU7CI76_9BACT